MGKNVLEFPKWYSLKNAGTKKASLEIRGTIGVAQEWREWGYDAAGTMGELERELKELGDVSEIELNIYSLGGYVWDALALHDVLVRHPAQIHGRVDGIAASAATIILMAADTIEVPANAFLMIHNATVGEYGNARDLQKMADNLRKWDRDIANIYVARIEDATGATDRAALLNQVSEMMDAETWLTGEEAVELGLADKSSDVVDLAAFAGLQNEKAERFAFPTLEKVPAPIRHLFDSAGELSEPKNENEPEKDMPKQPNQQEPSKPKNSDVEDEEQEEEDDNLTPEEEPETPDTPDSEDEEEEEEEGGSDDPTDLAQIVTNAVNAAVKPLQKQVKEQGEKLEKLENLRKKKVPEQAWGDKPPTGSQPKDSGEGEEEFDLKNINQGNYLQVINHGLKKARANCQPAAANN